MTSSEPPERKTHRKTLSPAIRTRRVFVGSATAVLSAAVIASLAAGELGSAAKRITGAVVTESERCTTPTSPRLDKLLAVRTSGGTVPLRLPFGGEQLYQVWGQQEFEQDPKTFEVTSRLRLKTDFLDGGESRELLQVQRISLFDQNEKRLCAGTGPQAGNNGWVEGDTIAIAEMVEGDYLIEVELGYPETAARVTAELKMSLVKAPIIGSAKVQGAGEPIYVRGIPSGDDGVVVQITKPESFAVLPVASTNAVWDNGGNFGLIKWSNGQHRLQLAARKIGSSSDDVAYVGVPLDGRAAERAFQVTAPSLAPLHL